MRPAYCSYSRQVNQVKIALTTSGNDLTAPIDSRFGRAMRFLIYDLEKGSFEILDNRQNLNSAQGAGIQSAETIARSGVDCLITGHCGPKAFRVLSAAGIRIFNTDAGTIAEAVEQFKRGNLVEAASADVEGHWA